MHPDPSTVAQYCSNDGGNPDTVWTSGTLKRIISGFTAGTTKNIDATSKRLIASVDVFEGDFGVQRIIPHRYIDSGSVVTGGYVYFMEMERWKINFLRRTTEEEMPKTGDSYKGRIVSEMTLSCTASEGAGRDLRLPRSVTRTGAG